VQAPEEKKIGRHNSYGRLSWDKPALAITGSSGKPSSSPCIHPDQHRALTLREAARLQGFPDDFRFVGGEESVRQQIGNAVPPPLGAAIGGALLRHFGDHQESVDAALLIRRNNRKRVLEIAGRKHLSVAADGHTVES
jgi:site-specific DNA-cytosine methylase